MSKQIADLYGCLQSGNMSAADDKALTGRCGGPDLPSSIHRLSGQQCISARADAEEHAGAGSKAISAHTQPISAEVAGKATGQFLDVLPACRYADSDLLSISHTQQVQAPPPLRTQSSNAKLQAMKSPSSSLQTFRLCTYICLVSTPWFAIRKQPHTLLPGG